MHNSHVNKYFGTKLFSIDCLFSESLVATINFQRSLKILIKGICSQSYLVLLM